MLSAELQDLLDDVLSDRRLLTHPFYRRWEAGELNDGELASYAAQYRHFEAALPELLETIIGSISDERVTELLAANLADERGVPAPHLALFDTFAAAVDAPASQAASEAMAALVAGYRELAQHRPVEAIAAIAAYETQAQEIAVSKSAGLRRFYGLSEQDTCFWDVHGTMESDHAAWTLDALAGIAEEPETMRNAMTWAAQAWWSFLDERDAAALSPA